MQGELVVNTESVTAEVAGLLELISNGSCSRCMTFSYCVVWLQVHWLGPRDKPPERYTIHRSRLICTREPGFVVQGFLWCNNRAKAQFAAQYKRAFPLDGSWNDAETAKIVSVRPPVQQPPMTCPARKQ